MKIEIQNLGQVKKALLEEKDLTVIVGDNGSGKTLLLEAKTFILNYYIKNVNTIVRELNKKYSDQFEFETDWTSVRKFIDDHTENTDKERPTYKFDMKVKLEDNVRDNINNDIKTWFEELKQQTINELNREILMVNESNLDFNLFINPSASEINYIKCELTLLDEHVSLIEMSSEESKDFQIIFPLINNSVPRELILESTDPKIIKEKNNLYDPLNDLKNKMKRTFIASFFKEITRSGETLYLPSERNLFMDDALTKTLKENYDNRYSFSRNNSKIRFSEFLFNMAYLNYKDILNRLKGDDHKLNPGLEKIFGGKIVFDEEGDIKSIHKNDGTIIKRELFSTKQNRLIPYLILNTPFEQYNKVIIEEPEAHLSLKSIRELLGYFKYLIKKGIKITITTHSDVFFSHLNNFILKDKDLDSKVYELKFSDGESILEEKDKTELGYEIDFFTAELNNLFEETLELQEKIDQEKD